MQAPGANPPDGPCTDPKQLSAVTRTSAFTIADPGGAGGFGTSSRPRAAQTRRWVRRRWPPRTRSTWCSREAFTIRRRRRADARARYAPGTLGTRLSGPGRRAGHLLRPDRGAGEVGAPAHSGVPGLGPGVGRSSPFDNPRVTRRTPAAGPGASGFGHGTITNGSDVYATR